MKRTVLISMRTQLNIAVDAMNEFIALGERESLLPNTLEQSEEYVQWLCDSIKTVDAALTLV